MANIHNKIHAGDTMDLTLHLARGYITIRFMAVY